jgi:hypothetical protein
LGPDVFAEILDQVPVAWLPPDSWAVYVDVLTRRLRASSNFVQEALRARADLV